MQVIYKSPIDLNQPQEMQSQQIVALVTDINNEAIEIPSNVAANNDDTSSDKVPRLKVPDPSDQEIIEETSEQPINNNEMENTTTTQQNEAIPPPQTRWTTENRVVLKQLMCSLSPNDIGAALRVILDAFGVESSKLSRRGDIIELDLLKIHDDYILDSLWNYCATTQHNMHMQHYNAMPQPMAQPMQMQQMHPYTQHVAQPQPPVAQHYMMHTPNTGTPNEQIVQINGQQFLQMPRYQ